MARLPSGEALLRDIHDIRARQVHDESRLMYYARSDILQGSQEAHTTDLAKFSVAMWGYDAPRFLPQLEEASLKLTNVAGELMLHRPSRDSLYGLERIHPEYIDEEARSSWVLEAVAEHGEYPGDEQNIEEVAWRDSGLFYGRLLLKVQIELPADSKGDDSRLEKVWSSRGKQAVTNLPHQNAPDLVVGQTNIFANQSNYRHLGEELTRLLALTHGYYKK